MEETRVCPALTSTKRDPLARTAAVTHMRAFSLTAAGKRVAPTPRPPPAFVFPLLPPPPPMPELFAGRSANCSGSMRKGSVGASALERPVDFSAGRLDDEAMPLKTDWREARAACRRRPAAMWRATALEANDRAGSCEGCPSPACCPMGEKDMKGGGILQYDSIMVLFEEVFTSRNEASQSAAHGAK